MSNRIPPNIIQDFGRILFGDHKGHPEEDTETESRYYGSIHDYDDLYSWESGTQSIFRELIEDYKYLLEIKNNYNDPDFDDVLDPFYKKNYKVMYRGLTFDQKEFAKYFKIPVGIRAEKVEENDELLDVTDYSKLAKYKPRLEIESWTIDYSMALWFAYPRVTRNIGVIIQYYNPRKIEKELLFEPDFMDEVVTLERGNKYLGQILRISKKPLKCKVYLSRWGEENDRGIDEAIDAGLIKFI